MTTSVTILAEKCDLLLAENDMLRERVRQLEAVLTNGYERLPIGGLTCTEAAVLAVIAAADGGAPKERILEAIYAWRSDREVPQPKILDVYVCKMRRKLAPLGVEIETVWGWGYRLPSESLARLAALREAVS